MHSSVNPQEAQFAVTTSIKGGEFVADVGGGGGGVGFGVGVGGEACDGVSEPEMAIACEITSD